jgi:hypothetical protein
MTSQKQAHVSTPQPIQGAGGKRYAGADEAKEEGLHCKDREAAHARFVNR